MDGCRCVLGCGAAPSRTLSRLAVLVLWLAACCTVSDVQGQGAPPPPPAGGSGTPLLLLNAVYATDEFSSGQAGAIWQGVDAALRASHYKSGDGRDIRVISRDPATDTADVARFVSEKVALHDPLTVVGPYSDERLATLLNTPVTAEKDLVYVSPFTGSSALRKWSDRVYFTRADPLAELKVIMTHILNKIRARRIAFMYVSNAHFGDEELLSVQTTLVNLSRAPAVVYGPPQNAADPAVDMDAFNAMADTQPQVIIVWGLPGPQTSLFLRQVLTDPRTLSATLMTCFALQQVVFEAFYSHHKEMGTQPRDNQVFASATALPPTERSTTHMSLFRTEMAAYIDANPLGFDYDAATSESDLVDRFGVPLLDPATTPAQRYFHRNPNRAQLMVGGWLAGKLLQQTLEQSGWVRNRSTYKSGLFRQNRYLVGGDYVIGDYGGDCNDLAASSGAVCRCNQGGHTAILTVLQKATWNLLSTVSFHFPQSMCYAADEALSKPLNILTLQLADHPGMLRAATEINAIVPMAMRAMGVVYESGNFATLNTTVATSQQSLDDEVRNLWVDIIAGPVLRDLDVGHLLVVTPVFRKPHVHVQRRNYIFVMPTLEQQLYVMYAQMRVFGTWTAASSHVVVTLRGYGAVDSANITTTLSKTAATFNLALPTIRNITEDDELWGPRDTGRINLVLGMRKEDADTIARYLAGETNSIVLLSFEDLAMYYAVLLAAFKTQPASVQARLISFNSLPLWSDTSDAAHAASPLLQFFHTLMKGPPAEYTPSLLRDLVAARFIQSLSASIRNVNSATMADAVYRSSVVTTDGITLGSYQWGCTQTVMGDECAYRNYGARDIVLLSMQRILDPSVPPLAPAVTPSMIYTPHDAQPQEMTTAQRNGVIAGSIIGGVALIAAVALIVYCCSDSRNNNAAPKDGDEPVTLVFTDIESSTALWAALPQMMADAIAAHHRVIRQLLKKYKCYEVKTIGDSFMIACKDAHSAVRLACEVQTKLLSYDWGTAEIDAAYRQFELARVDSVDGYVPTTARLSPEEYEGLWRGLRVRMGLHTGLSDIRYDEVTKGYDYYGDTSNMAARTEAVANGGQVVATETTWWALSDPERDAVSHTVMGPQGLRGVPHAVGMYQLNPVPGRTHAALRTEIEAILPDDGAGDTASNGADALLSSSDLQSGPAAKCAFVITSCFAPYPPVQRIRELQPLLAKWNIGAPPRMPNVSEEDYCQGLINRLAIRIATVTQARERLHQVEFGNTLSPNGGPSGVVNPLAGDRGLLGASARRISVAAASTAAERAAAHESRVFRRGLLAPLPPTAPGRKSSRGASPSGELTDAVVPFPVQRTRGPSLENSGVFEGLSSPGEAVMVRMPNELRLRRRTSHSDASELMSGEV
ncbi:receptor-type adenylate cyclase [Novymonas esmeraldas]|uniref:adenylate cyclase n=1 Tax=Novymonas esmeraldas TaxID=1808958 RepID=A0AAW0EYM5_9TRYP